MRGVICIQKDNYGLKMLLTIVILFIIMAAMFFKIQQKDPIVQNSIIPIVSEKTIYLLKSYSTALTYHKNGLGKDKYTLKLEKFNKLITSLGYKTKYIQEDKVSSLGSDDILFMIDALSLSINTKEDIKTFLKNGGNLFFNFTAGFSDENGTYLGENFVSEITKLRLSSEKKFVTFKEGIFLTQRVLSPLNNINSGQLLQTSLYDQIPIYKTPKNVKPDFFMTTFSQTTPPLAKDKTNNFLLEESGVAWHGYFGKGKWFYFNLPSYIFYDHSANIEDYKKISHSIINFLSQKAVIQKFPYADVENVVFISEDTEFRFENFSKFSKLAKKYKIPVTAFIVSSLAENREHDAMIRKIARNPYVEFGSHSHLHKKIIDTNETYVNQEINGSKIILDKFVSKKVIGFRPPREELDSFMKKNLNDSDFKYVLGKSERYLYPRLDEKEKNLLIIPRHGTDDYSYLINLDWNQKHIIDQIKRETEFVTALDGIFTLSIHTHLFAYSTNINIVEEYFKYLNLHPNFTPLNGETITKKIHENKNFYLEYSIKENTITINIENRSNSKIKNFYCRVFKNPNLEAKLVNKHQPHVSIESKNKNSIDLRFRYIEPNKKITLYLELKEKS